MRPRRQVARTALRAGPRCSQAHSHTCRNTPSVTCDGEKKLYQPLRCMGEDAHVPWGMGVTGGGSPGGNGPAASAGRYGPCLRPRKLLLANACQTYCRNLRHAFSIVERKPPGVRAKVGSQRACAWHRPRTKYHTTVMATDKFALASVRVACVLFQVQMGFAAPKHILIMSHLGIHSRTSKTPGRD